MTWLQRYRVQHFLRFSFWAAPTASMVAALILVRVVRWLDHLSGWTWLDVSADGARAIVGGLSASMLTFVVFAVSSLLIVVQLASGQITPRIIAPAFAGRLVKATVSAFVFCFMFSLAALGRIEDDRVPQLIVLVTVLSSLASLALFFWFVQRLGMNLRPAALMQMVFDEGRRVMDDVYPHEFDPAKASPPEGGAGAPPPQSRIVEHIGSSGTLLAFASAELVAAAKAGGCTIELIPRVGDFVSRGDPLFRLYPADAGVRQAALHRMIAVGPERTLEQDPALAFRIMVDIAARALSAAVNDPTTAVLAIDQIHRLLRHAGQKDLAPGRVHDAEGKLRLVYRTAQWGEFVALAVTEIRLFGASSIQVARRLRALLEHLVAVLPEARAAALHHELAMLAAAVEHLYPAADDRRRASIPDLQGIGGAPG